MMQRRAFFKHTYKTRCKFEEGREEVTHIGDNIQIIVQALLRELGDTNPIFRISKIIPTGSFYENTKVGSPDEFDFMVVLENLSQTGSIELKQGCTPWYPKVKILKNTSLYNKYIPSLNFDKKPNEYLGEPSSLVYDFWKELSSLISRNPPSVKTSFGTISTVPSKTQKLQFEYIRSPNVPAPADTPCNGLILMKKILIGVDLMLAIEHPDISSVLSTSGFPQEFRPNLKQNGCHIIAKSCHTPKHFPNPPCWFISFAACELETMKAIDEKHKEAYKILKCLLIGEINYPGKCMNLSSYLLKTALMFHVRGENKCINPRHYSSCIDDILGYLKKGFYNIDMPCFFARDLNTWGYLLEVPCFNWQFDLSDDEKKIGEKEMYALLWLKLWYTAIDGTETLITKESCADQDNWLAIVDRFDLFKASIRFLLEQYYNSGKVYKSQLKRTEMKLNNLNEIVNERFKNYVKKLHEEYNMKLYQLLSSEIQ